MSLVTVSKDGRGVAVVKYRPCSDYIEIEEINFDWDYLF